MSIIHLNTETKIIGGIVLVSFILLVGGAFLFASQGVSDKSIPQDQIVASNGLHWHPKLTIIIKGEKQEIPSGIGLTGTIHQEMHTHDEDAKDGVIHMEMNGVVTREETKLGNFFKIWGKTFNRELIFDKKNGEEGKVKMFVNGEENNKFENYEMRDGVKIEIRYE